MNNSDALITDNLKLVHHFARKLARGEGTVYDDLVGEGYIGLVKAARMFEPERGVAFTTYAAYWIRCFCFNYLSDYTHGIVRVPRNHGNGLRWRLPKMRAKLKLVGIEPTPEMLAAQLECSIAEVEDAIMLDGRSEVSLDQQLKSSTSGRKLSEVIGDSAPSPEDALASAHNHAIATRYLSMMSEMDQDILRSRFMSPPQTLAEIGDRYGVSRERIRQLEKVAIRRMKMRLALGGYAPPKEKRKQKFSFEMRRAKKQMAVRIAAREKNSHRLKHGKRTVISIG